MQTKFTLYEDDKLIAEGLSLGQVIRKIPHGFTVEPSTARNSKNFTFIRKDRFKRYWAMRDDEKSERLACSHN